MPFCHARSTVYLWMLGPLSTNMYQFDERTAWIGTSFCRDKKVYRSLVLFLTLLTAGNLAHCSTSYVSFVPSPL